MSQIKNDLQNLDLEQLSNLYWRLAAANKRAPLKQLQDKMKAIEDEIYQRRQPGKGYLNDDV